MNRSIYSPESISQLCSQLGASYPEGVCSSDELRRKGKIPKDLGFRTDVCISLNGSYVLVHALTSEEVPKWIIDAQLSLRRKTKARAGILILAISTAENGGVSVAGKIAENCKAHALGLACESLDGALLVFRPYHRFEEPCKTKTERGHIPSRLRFEFARRDGFSTYLTKCFKRFFADYTASNRSAAPTYENECDRLIKLAREISHGDRRLFYPLARLQVLAEWEAARANTRARDHFFHTFNNLFNGYLVLHDLFYKNRDGSESPDCYIKDEKAVSETRTWETLWFLTCLLHDPGYVGEKFWSTVSFSLGIESSSPNVPIPESVATLMQEAWKNDFAEPRNDLLELFKRISGSWAPARTRLDIASKFDDAIAEAYFDGKSSSHSLLSGLTLIKRCLTDQTPKHDLHNPGMALAASEIAGLCMMFHDQGCREKLKLRGLRPISFEHLPYAGMLMFVDVLQDDRRDITKNVFPKHGVLQAIGVDAANKIVSADVCLREVPLRYWPKNIAEYASVMHWLNSVSKVKFLINYRERVGI